MMINEPAKKDASKELKVKIPIRYHLQLHNLKLTEGLQIHGVVQDALEKYFATLRVELAPKAR